MKERVWRNVVKEISMVLSDVSFSSKVFSRRREENTWCLSPVGPIGPKQREHLRVVAFSKEMLFLQKQV